jgi:hypothetical protein
MMRPCVPPVSECRQAAASRNRSRDSVENGSRFICLCRTISASALAAERAS